MRNVQPREIQAYRTENGREPFTEWYDSIRDEEVENRIGRRLDRIRDGNFGDYRSVGGGVSEVAKKIGIAPQVLSDVLSSEKAPRLDTLNTILQALGCRLSIQPLRMRIPVQTRITQSHQEKAQIRILKSPPSAVI